MVSSLCGWSLPRQSGYCWHCPFPCMSFWVKSFKFLLNIGIVTVFSEHTWTRILTLFPGINHLVSDNLDDVAIRELIGVSPLTLFSLKCRYAHSKLFPLTDMCRYPEIQRNIKIRKLNRLGKMPFRDVADESILPEGIWLGTHRTVGSTWVRY